MRISSELIKGGSPWQRMGEIFAGDLGIPLKQQINNADHAVMDLEHSHVLMQVARKHVLMETAQAGITGAMERLLIDRVCRNHLADMVKVLP
jgi:hypothetical protein